MKTRRGIKIHSHHSSNHKFLKLSVIPWNDDYGFCFFSGSVVFGLSSVNKTRHNRHDQSH